MKSTKNDTIDVLIAGAGPAGLMMACQLDRFNITFRIIDKKTSPAHHSGALIVHARTMEVFHQLGLAEKALQAGIIAKTINFQFNLRKKFVLDVKEIGKGLTRFSSLLMLEQWQTENLLIDFLSKRGHRVENNTALISFTEENEKVTSQILKPDGAIEFVKSRFLIGADGSNSLVRKQLDIPFSGKTQASRLFITDCQARLQVPAREISFSFASDFTSGYFPLPENRWRVDGHIPVIQEKEVEFENVRDFLASKLHSGIHLHSPQWFSVFRSHSRCAGTFRKSQCFLIGDAAHVHSPVGAQGMNTGLQDAHNLGWKLAFFIRGKASDNLLNTFESERRPLALSIIRSTDMAYSFMTDSSFLIRFLRLKVVPLLLPMLLSGLQKNLTMRRRIFNSISQIGIKYKGSIMEDSSSNSFPGSAPKPGDRFLHLTYETGGQQVALYDALNGPVFYLLIFGKQFLPASFQSVMNKYTDVISVIIIEKESGTLHLFKSLGIQNEGCFLIRPDHFIAWRCQDFNAKSLEDYLQQFMK